MNIFNNIGLPRPPHRSVSEESLQLQHAAAEEMRETVLDMMDFGVLGSDVSIPDAEIKSGIKLPALLRYSPHTMQHYKTFVGVLSDLRQYQLTDTPETSWDSDEAHGNVIFESEDMIDMYVYPHHFTAPYLNALLGALHITEKGHPYLSIRTALHKGIYYNQLYGKIMDSFEMRRIRPNAGLRKALLTLIPDYYYNKKMDGVWSTRYIYSHGSSYNVYDQEFLDGNYAGYMHNIGHDSLFDNPAKTLLLDYIFSPRELSPEDIVEHSFMRKIRNNIKVTKTGKGGPYEAFDVTELYYDSKKFIKFLERIDYPDERPDVLFSQYALQRYAQEQIGDQIFSIVKLGVKDINGTQYHIYTGGEGSMLQSREDVPIRDGVMKALFSL